MRNLTPRKLPPEDAYIEAIRLYYRQTVRPERENQAMEGLLSFYEHNRDHHGKMISSLKPILEALTSDTLGELLSPDYDDPDDPRPILDLAKICRKGEVVYMALDSLSNPTVGSMIGALMLADLTAVAGSRYNFDTDDPIPVNVFVDELAEVASELFITTINKSRGALFRVAFAGQTLADLEVRFGREAYAYQILGNANHVIGMRSRDPQTQQYLSDNIGTTRTSISDFHHPTSTRTDESDIDFERNTAVRFSHTDGQARVEPPAFGKLPDLEAIATLVDGRTVKLKIPFNPVPPDERYPQRNFL
jgi:conjugal transfer pilus assembly protein TraD